MHDDLRAEVIATPGNFTPWRVEISRAGQVIAYYGIPTKAAGNASLRNALAATGQALRGDDGAAADSLWRGLDSLQRYR